MKIKDVEAKRVTAVCG